MASWPASTIVDIVKDIPKSYYLNFTEDIWPRLRHPQHPNIRLPCDTIPNERVLVYRYLSHDLLELARTRIDSQTRRRILKSALQGLAEMHDHDIVHLDIKPDNVVVECQIDAADETMKVDAVQLTDFENAVWLRPGKNVCIYIMLGRIKFGRDEDFEYHVSQGIEPGLIRLQRQRSYFGDEEGYRGLRRHFEDNEQFCQLLDAIWEDRTASYIPYQHFPTWPEVEDGDFKDVVLGLMSLDPRGRITAREALRHPWFAELEIS
ncbi:hypothetical protein CERZMDRAFT_114971 [Cercospora zeae-maydis SCOH1-5]|uniref:Protein kinase domain-containing protein n=1 Tax=Cercospora zeae-maydis SCOH1-5 TaxID=717836 RepID=A0A6A6F3Q3_9PEZI|nr:hypothetical protein CERZMDRAFT_114971 [Cercospora zeae-maydis SCOH1-5]